MRVRIAVFLLSLLAAFAAAAGPLDSDFDNLERVLRLKPEQKAQFQVAVAATQRALLAVAMSGLEVKERVSAEMAKPRPDLNILYDIHEQVVERNAPLFREARDEWSKLYGLLDPEQVTVAKRYLEKRLDLLLPPPPR